MFNLPLCCRGCSEHFTPISAHGQEVDVCRVRGVHTHIINLSACPQGKEMNDDSYQISQKGVANYDET